MTVNTVDIITLSLVIAGSHASDLAEKFLLPGAEVVAVVMAAIEIRTRIGPLQVKDIAEFELLDSLDLFPGDGWIKFVNPLPKPIPVNTGDRLSNSWLDW